MTRKNMTEQQCVQLRDLLVLYYKDAHLNDQDAIIYFIDEIEKNELGIDYDHLTTSQDDWD